MHVSTTNMSASMLSAYADNKIEDSVQEDRKLNKARRSTAMKNQIDSSKAKIRENKEAADEELQATKDKTSGGFWGALIGAIIAALAVIAAIAITVVSWGTMAPAMIAALVGIATLVGGAGAGLGPAIGGAVGASNAEDNEEAAAVAEELADKHDLSAKTWEKEAEDLKDLIRANQQQLDQISQARRKREADRMNVALKA